jgi:hypothetical protein
MPDHWHLVLIPKSDTVPARFMGWIGVKNVRRRRQHDHHQAGGHLYQGRFKSFPVPDDRHSLKPGIDTLAGGTHHHVASAVAIWYANDPKVPLNFSHEGAGSCPGSTWGSR